MSANEKKIVGIDLGTTFSVVAHIDEYKRPVTILNSDGQTTTASAVLYNGVDDIVVGQMARDQAIASENVVTLVKREMGTPTRFTLAGKEFTPEEISAIILKKLKQDAEERLNISITDAVITVPAYFGTAERKATQDAGEMAGFNVHYILNEPEAAALAFAFAHPDLDETVLVYDLGGGTFDITLLTIKPPAPGSTFPQVGMISTGGNHRLGGADWDQSIMDHVAGQFAAAHYEDPRDDLSSKQDLYQRCESAKIALARVSSTKIVCQHGGQKLVVDLDRARLFELTKHLLDLTETEVDGLLAAKGYTADQIDRVMLVGGSTKLIMVRELLERKFPGKLDSSINPDEAVGQGAAWVAYLIQTGEMKSRQPGEPFQDLADEDSAGELGHRGPLTPVASHALGVAAYDETRHRKIYPLIVKDAKLPCRGKDTFQTMEAGQTSVEIDIYETEARDLTDAQDIDAGRQIGQGIVISGLPPGRPAAMPVEVTFIFDECFQLTVEAVDVTSGIRLKDQFNVSGLTDDKKAAMGKMLDSATVQGGA